MWEKTKKFIFKEYSMKNVLKVTALSLGIALASGFASANENIAFINAAYLLQHHPDREAVASKLEAEFKPEAEKLAANKKDIEGKEAESRKKIEAKIASLQKDAPRLRQAEVQKREEEINNLIASEQGAIDRLKQAHDKQFQEFQAKSLQREDEEKAKLIDNIQNTTNKIAQARGYTYVLEASSVVFAVEGKNITEDVLKSLKDPNAPVAAPAPAPAAQ